MICLLQTCPVILVVVCITEMCRSAICVQFCLFGFLFFTYRPHMNVRQPIKKNIS